MQRSFHSLGVACAFAVVALFGCAEADPACLDSDCTTPPPPRCSDGLLLTFDPVGECIQDTCRYAATLDECPAGCAPAPSSLSESEACAAGEP